jgi:hypothetical protein
VSGSAAAHRPWPAPARLFLMEQVWEDLLFAHWPLAPEVLRPLVPPTLELDTREGRAWVAVAPFRMSGIRFRGTTPLPGASAFPELNLRTYVTADGKAGVYFFSLEAANPFAVAAARLFLALPYHWARISCRASGPGVSYSSERLASGRIAATFRAEYEPAGGIALSTPGSLEHWLTERYCLYAVRRGRVRRVEIDHEPWPLQPARARIERNDVPAAAGIDLPARSPVLLHFARRLAVRIWSADDVRA